MYSRRWRLHTHEATAAGHWCWFRSSRRCRLRHSRDHTALRTDSWSSLDIRSCESSWTVRWWVCCRDIETGRRAASSSGEVRSSDCDGTSSRTWDEISARFDTRRKRVRSRRLRATCCDIRRPSSLTTAARHTRTAVCCRGHSRNKFDDFPENQLTKSYAVYIVKANRGPKFCRYSFTQDSSWVTMITEGRTEITSFHGHTLIY